MIKKQKLIIMADKFILQHRRQLKTKDTYGQITHERAAQYRRENRAVKVSTLLAREVRKMSRQQLRRWGRLISKDIFVEKQKYSKNPVKLWKTKTDKKTQELEKKMKEKIKKQKKETEANNKKLREERKKEQNAAGSQF